TYAEPALFYQLAARSVSTRPISNLSFSQSTSHSTTNVFLVTGPHADRSRPFAAEWAKVADRFLPLSEFQSVATDLVRLNSEQPQANGELAPDTQHRLQLFQLRIPIETRSSEH
ncbi:MAG: hypothetical protein ABGZ17_20620, partial [Planctomycetaceae bacterium]